MDSETAQPKKEKDRRPRDPAHWITRTIEKYRKRTIASFNPDADFFALADDVVSDRRTLLGHNRLYVLWQAVRNVADLPGTVAEIGSYRGGSAEFLARSFINFTGSEVPMHIFDTFEGHPESAITSNDEFQGAGQFGGTSFESVQALLAPFTRLTIHKGDVSSSLPHLADDRYRLVHIDTDLYQPTMACLEYFGARMVPMGIIVIDDYGAKKCPGVPKAVSDYLAGGDGFQIWDSRTDQLLLVKR